MNGEPSRLPRPGALARRMVVLMSGRPGSAMRRPPGAAPPQRGRKGGQHIAPEGQAGHPEAQWVGRVVGEGEPDPDHAQCDGPPTGRGCRAGRAVSRCAVAAGMTSRAKTSNAPVICVAAAAARPSSTRNAPPSSLTGTPCDSGHGGIDRGEQQGTADECHDRDDAHRDHEQGEDLAVRDAQEGAEQEGVDPLQEAAVEGDEEKAAGEGEGLHRADDRRLLAKAAQRRHCRVGRGR